MGNKLYPHRIAVEMENKLYPHRIPVETGNVDRELLALRLLGEEQTNTLYQCHPGGLTIHLSKPTPRLTRHHKLDAMENEENRKKEISKLDGKG